jgi:HAD superfamily hydrolase (TIGR01509 family)
VTLRALLFDLDGTLAETESYGHRPAYNDAFRELGLSFRWGERLYKRLLERASGKERLHHYLRRYRPELGPHADAIAESEEAWVEHVHALKSQHFDRRLSQGEVPLRPGVSRLLHEASDSGLRLAVVSNASARSIKSFLKHGLGSNLTRRVSLVVGGESGLKRKPAPDLYRHALDRLKLAHYECIAIEDSEVGLAAARGAGIPTVITVNAETLSQDFQGASLVLDHLGDPGATAAVLRGHMDEPWLTLKTLRRIAQQAAPRL